MTTKFPPLEKKTYSELVAFSTIPGTITIPLHPYRNEANNETYTRNIIVPNLSSFANTNIQTMLSVNIFELREIENFSIVSNCEEIEEVEQIVCGKSPFCNISKAMTSLGGLLLQYSLYDAAYYFYFSAIVFAQSSATVEDQSVLTHDPLLQIAKMIHVGHVIPPQDSGKIGLARQIFLFLINNFDSDEAASFDIKE